MYLKTTLLLVLLLAWQSTALYFHIGETEKKCFIEEIPDETLLVGKYKVEIFDKANNRFVTSQSGLGMHVEISDPDRAMVLSRIYGDQGQFSVTSLAAGEHAICLRSNSSAWFGFGQQLRVHLDIQVGEHAQDYLAIASSERLSDLELRLRQLLDQTALVAKEQTYQRHREVIFRFLSESTNSRVLWWSVLQTVVLLSTGFLQMRHLKSFFVAKKLV